MVKEVRIYFEGDPSLRQGFHEFLSDVVDLARKKRVRFKLVAGGATPVADFMTAVTTHSDSFNVLLVDSDLPDDGRLIARLKDRGDWNAPVARAVVDDQLHFMIQVMETWFLADSGALKSYYGRDFVESRLPGNLRVEQIRKTDVYRGLEDATRLTQKGKYDKTRHASQLLGKIDASTVRNAAPACNRFLTSLEQILQ